MTTCDTPLLIAIVLCAAAIISATIWRMKVSHSSEAIRSKHEYTMRDFSPGFRVHMTTAKPPRRQTHPHVS